MLEWYCTYVWDTPEIEIVWDQRTYRQRKCSDLKCVWKPTRSRLSVIQPLSRKEKIVEKSEKVTSGFAIATCHILMRRLHIIMQATWHANTRTSNVYTIRTDVCVTSALLTHGTPQQQPISAVTYTKDRRLCAESLIIWLHAWPNHVDIVTSRMPWSCAVPINNAIELVFKVNDDG